MQDRNEFWQNQPDLFALTIQAANQKAGILDSSSSAAILWHYSGTDAETVAVRQKEVKLTRFFIITGLIVSLLILGGHIIFNVLGFDIDTIIMAIRARLFVYIFCLALSIFVIVLIRSTYISIRSIITFIKKKKNDQNFLIPQKNKTYLLSHDGLYIYLPNKNNRALTFQKKIAVSDISALKASSEKIEIYTNSLSPIIIILPSTEAETLKQHLLGLSADILDADKN